jgi:hypothetical protein
MFQNPILTRIPYSSKLQKRKEDFRINSTFRFDSPSLYGTSKAQQI